jgi:hypothetical protein
MTVLNWAHVDAQIPFETAHTRVSGPGRGGARRERTDRDVPQIERRLRRDGDVPHRLAGDRDVERRAYVVHALRRRVGAAVHDDRQRGLEVVVVVRVDGVVEDFHVIR